MSFTKRKHTKGYYAFMVSGAVSVSLLYTVFSNDSEAVVHAPENIDDYYSTSASAILSNDFNYGFGKSPKPDSVSPEVRLTAPQWLSLDGKVTVSQIEANASIEAPVPSVATANVNYQTTQSPVEAVFNIEYNKPRIAIIIDDMGVRQNMTKPFAALPVPINFSFLPYADGLTWQTEVANAAGHELMLHLPMEPSVEGQNPGPKALLTSLSNETLAEYIDWNLARFDGFVGINNHMGSRFTENASLMAIVVERMKSDNLFFIDSRTSSKSTGYKVAKDHGLQYEDRDVFLDNELNQEAIFRQFEELERLAIKNGYAIAIGHPHSETLVALNAWLPTLDARGFEVVKVSSLLKQGKPLPDVLSTHAKVPQPSEVSISGGGR